MREFDWFRMPHDVVKLLDIPPRAALKRLTLRVTLTETMINKFKKEGSIMRCEFNTQLKVDIASDDDALRKAFIDLITAKAREVFGVAGMLAKGSPLIEVNMVTSKGKEVIPLFDGALVDDDDDYSGE